MTHPVQMVLFDCDGVLVDSEPITNAVLRESLASYGLEVSAGDVERQFVGGTMMGVMDEALKMGADLPDHWLDEIYAGIFSALERSVEIIPGVHEVLDALDAAGIPYAVGSNGPHAKMDITLAKTGLATRLKGRVWSREDVAAPKPAPDLYLAAAAALGVSADRCVVIEDSVSGARAAKAAGMRCFGFVAAGGEDRMTLVCDRLFSDMLDLPGLLELPGQS